MKITDVGWEYISVHAGFHTLWSYYATVIYIVFGTLTLLARDNDGHDPYLNNKIKMLLLQKRLH